MSGELGLGYKKFWTNARLQQLARLLVLALGLNILGDMLINHNAMATLA